MKFSLSLFLFQLISGLQLFSQDLAIFDLPLYGEKLSLTEAIVKYNYTENFKFIKIGKNLHSLVAELDDKVFNRRSTVLKVDPNKSDLFALSQVALGSRAFHHTQENFNDLHLMTLDIINELEKSLGKPTKIIIKEDRFWECGDINLTGSIIMCAWNINGIKLKIDFFKQGEHNHSSKLKEHDHLPKEGPYNHFKYHLSIVKYEDYYGNMKLTPWWNGYESIETNSTN